MSDTRTPESQLSEFEERRRLQLAMEQLPDEQREALSLVGASGFAYDLARQFGLKVVEPRPALVPLTLGGDDVLFRELSGVATPVEARAGKAAFREAALFTHKGLSGPAILQISSYWRHGDPVGIDCQPFGQHDVRGRRCEPWFDSRTGEPAVQQHHHRG